MGLAASDRPWGARAPANRAEKPQFMFRAAGIFLNVCILSNKLLKTPWLSFGLGLVHSSAPRGEWGGIPFYGGALGVGFPSPGEGDPLLGGVSRVGFLPIRDKRGQWGRFPSPGEALGGGLPSWEGSKGWDSLLGGGGGRSVGWDSLPGVVGGMGFPPIRDKCGQWGRFPSAGEEGEWDPLPREVGEKWCSGPQSPEGSSGVGFWSLEDSRDR